MQAEFNDYVHQKNPFWAILVQKNQNIQFKLKYRT